jgi:hypothetical protein
LGQKPPLKLVAIDIAEILLKVAPKINQIIINKNITSHEIFISFKFKNILYHRQNFVTFSA